MTLAERSDLWQRIEGTRVDLWGLSLRGQTLSVQPKVFDLLALLARHAGRVVSKQELMEQLWPEVHVSEASLQRAVSLLRRTLREGGFEHALKSFTGHGYRFSLDQPDLSSLLNPKNSLPHRLHVSSHLTVRWIDAS